RRGLLGGAGAGARRGARRGVGGVGGRFRRGRGGAFGGLGGASRGVAASDLHLVGRHVVDDDPARDRIGALGEDRVVGQGDDVVDLVHVDVTAFAHHVDVLAVGALAKHGGVALGDRGLELVVLEAHLDAVGVQANGPLAQLDVAGVHAQALLEVDVHRVGVDHGRLVAVGLEGAGRRDVAGGE